MDSKREKSIHVPVLPEEIIQYIHPSPGDIIVDSTLGTGGHTKCMLEYTEGLVQIIGIDKDEKVLHAAKERLKEYKDSIRFFCADFKDFDEVMNTAGIENIQGCLFDLGVSSYQIDDPQRGFSYNDDGPLDMRMDQNSVLNAEKVIHDYSRGELIRVFKSYADERNPEKVADAVIRERDKERIDTTKKLAQVLRRASSGRKGTAHPEAPLFMAVRIEVNREFEAISAGVEKAISYLNPGGRICVISFHSGEDRIIKHLLKMLEEQETVSVLTRTPVTPSVKESRGNPRARSAKMRVAERN